MLRIQWQKNPFTHTKSLFFIDFSEMSLIQTNKGIYTSVKKTYNFTVSRDHSDKK